MRLAASILAAVAVANTAHAETWSASADGFDLGLKTLVIGSGRSTEIPGLVLEGYKYVHAFTQHIYKQQLATTDRKTTWKFSINKWIDKCAYDI